jgi:hypothetical protein
MARLVKDQITAAFVIRFGDKATREIPVEDALQFMCIALKEYGTPEAALAAFYAELERLKRRA